jgi:hypothetical protein
MVLSPVLSSQGINGDFFKLSLAQAEVGSALGGAAAGRVLAGGRRSGSRRPQDEAAGRALTTAAESRGQEKGGLSGGDEREVSRFSPICRFSLRTMTKTHWNTPLGGFQGKQMPSNSTYFHSDRSVLI